MHLNNSKHHCNNNQSSMICGNQKDSNELMINDNQQKHSNCNHQSIDLVNTPSTIIVAASSTESTTSCTSMGTKRMVNVIVRKRSSFGNHSMMSAVRSKPSLLHAIVVIFLEFFAWGLLTLPAISVLNTTFPDRTFLMNGLIMGVKGFLSFLSAPLIGALSDLWGRKFFLLITVFFTCLPIPFMKFSPILYFGLVILSGIFSVTFSVIFAYVADITEEYERSHAYGWVTATFALSLIISPALGAFISTSLEDDNLVICLSTAVAIFDVIYILLFVPESLPEKLRQKSISIWESADPFSSIRRAGKDRMILTLCVAVFLSYLPEAGQYSCFFVYLKLVIGFNQIQVASYIALIGIMSVIAQTLLLTILMKRIGSKNTIMIGLIFEMLQLICFGLGSSHWVVWSAGVIAALGTITYPAISAYVSTYADADKQGLVQGIITGIRGLCNGLGPCFFGLIFSLFNVDLVRQPPSSSESIIPSDETMNKHMMPSITNMNGSFITFLNSTTNQFFHSPTDQVIPGPPFLFGSLLVLIAILVMAFIPELVQYPPSPSNSNGHYSENYTKGSNNSYKSSMKRSPKSTNSHNYYYKNMHHTQLDACSSNNQCSINNDDFDEEYEEDNDVLDVSMFNNSDVAPTYSETIDCPLSCAYNLTVSKTSHRNQHYDKSLSPFMPASSASSYALSSEGDSDIDSKQRLLPSPPEKMNDNSNDDDDYNIHRSTSSIKTTNKDQISNVMNTIVTVSPKPNHHATTALHWPHSSTNTSIRYDIRNTDSSSANEQNTSILQIPSSITNENSINSSLKMMRSQPIHRPLNLSKSLNTSFDKQKRPSPMRKSSNHNNHSNNESSLVHHSCSSLIEHSKKQSSNNFGKNNFNCYDMDDNNILLIKLSSAVVKS